MALLLFPVFRLPIDANDLLPIADEPNAEEETKQVLSARPQSLSAHRFANKDTLLHELAVMGNLPLLRGAVEAARSSWESLHKKPKSPTTKSKLCQFFSTRRVASPMEPLDSDADIAENQRVAVQNFLDAKNDLNQTALMLAAHHDRVACVRYLLEQGADPWIEDRCGNLTTLHHACMRSSAECVQAIMESMRPEFGVKDNVRYVNCRTAFKATPLLYAVACENLPALQTLLAFDPDVVASTGCANYVSVLRRFSPRTTPLHVAAELGRLDIARELLKHYAWRSLTGGTEEDSSPIVDPRVLLDADSHTPLSLVARSANRETKEQLFVLLSTATELTNVFPLEDLVKEHATGVQRLAILAAASLRAKLVGELEACSPEHGRPLQGMRSENSSHLLSSSSSLSSDKGTCGICFDCPVEVEVSKVGGQGCAHPLCHACAYKLCPTLVDAPLPCPYCRQPVPGFKEYKHTL